MKFKVRCVDREGKTRQGSVSAKSVEEATARIKAKGFVIVAIEPEDHTTPEPKSVVRPRPPVITPDIVARPTTNHVKGSWPLTFGLLFVVVVIAALLVPLGRLGLLIAAVPVVLMARPDWRQRCFEFLRLEKRTSTVQQFVVLGTAAFFITIASTSNPKETTTPIATNRQASVAVSPGSSNSRSSKPDEEDDDGNVVQPDDESQAETETASDFQEPAETSAFLDNDETEIGNEEKTSGAVETNPARILEQQVSVDNASVQVNDYANDTTQKIVLVRWDIGDNLTDGMIRSSAQIDVVEILESIREIGMPVHEVTVFGSFPLVDQYGNSSKDVVVKATYSGTTIQQINFDNFLFQNVYNIAESTWFHPAFRNE